ncbi:hypothetical protein L3Y34_003205 [Caenorhabditis briggsae]|uniref:ELM2 domain-containing protein n=1 Tax=Caenorhabditis briggsae TaxID=6238 RepID=A0AAE9D3D2_CAEBR|nr:hypothetical protein L3Y34_003205 [Caenorhabditis briggsae]
MSSAAPVKRSLRLQEKFNIFDKDLSANVEEHKRYQPRGTIIPLGLGHESFKFESRVIQKAVREQAKLKVTMNSGKSLQKADNSVKIGPEHQADLDSFTPKATDEMEREELMWTPPTRDMDYQKLKHYYLDPVWRQFGGQVSMEVGLQNLIECGYDFAKGLDSIDKKLRDLPQRLKPLANIQMKSFEKLLSEKTEVPLRTLQERAMRTYHIAEVQQFRCAMENYKMGIKKQRTLPVSYREDSRSEPQMVLLELH